MGPKFFALFLVAVLSLQGCANAKHISVVEERGIVEDITKVVEEIRHSVEKLIVEGIAAVKEAFDQINAIAQEELNKAMEKIAQLAEQAIADIEEFEKMAEELGYDIKECVLAQKENIHAAVTKYQQGVQECVAGLVQEFAKMYDDLLQTTNEAYERIYALFGEFYECADWTCRKEVLSKLVNEMNIVSVQVRGIVDAAVREMQKQIPGVVECIRGEVAAYQADIQKIVEDIKKCIAESGNENTQISSRSIEEEIAKIIEQIREAFKVIVEQAVASLKKAYEEFVAFYEQLVEKAKNKIKELADKLFAEIEKIKEEAKELGIDIKDCLEEATPAINELIAKTEQSIADTVSHFVQPIASIYADVLHLAQDINNSIANLVNDVAQCTDVQCFITVYQNFKALLARINGEFVDLAAKVSKDIPEAVNELTVNMGNIVDEYVAGVDKITADFKQCFDNKQQ